MEPINIAKKTIGPGHPTFIIAEIGINHNGDPELAQKMIAAAAEAGADAVKFQTFKAETLLTKDTAKARYVEETTGASETFYELFKRLELSPETYRELYRLAKEHGLFFMSTPFDEASADFLLSLGVPAFKVASGDLTHLPFLEYLAKMGLPLLISTGMATMDEVAEAVDTVRSAGNTGLVLLHCTSNYPTALENVNLRAMTAMGSHFGVPVGYSDHTEGLFASVAAVALGASVIEKHFTLDKNLPGPDQRLSCDPAELADLVKSIRAVEKTLGSGVKEAAGSEEEIKAVGRRSLVTARSITAGAVLTREDLIIKRPGTGIPPKYLYMVLGTKVLVDINADEVLTWDKLEEIKQ